MCNKFEISKHCKLLKMVYIITTKS